MIDKIRKFVINKLSKHMMFILDDKTTTKSIQKLDNLDADVFNDAEKLIYEMNKGVHYDIGAIKESNKLNHFEALSLMIKAINPDIKLIKYKNEENLMEKVFTVR